MKKINPEIMRYQKNSTSFWLCMLAIVVDVLHFVFLYEARTVVPDINLGIDIIVNIFFLLIIFLASEKSKAYVKSWSYVLFGASVLQILRIFYLPLTYFNAEQLAASGTNGFVSSVILLFVSACSLVGAGIINLIKSTVLNTYLKNTDRRMTHN